MAEEKAYKKFYRKTFSSNIFIKIICITLILAMCTFASYAHPGSLDENNGHYNRSTGVYHYHDGLNTGHDTIFEEILSNLVLIFWGIVGVFVFVLNIWCKISDAKDRKIQEQLANEEKLRFEKERAQYYTMYAHKDILALCKCPEGTYISEDGLPATYDDGKYGKYTVYVPYMYRRENRTYKYHHKANCGGNLLMVSNIVLHPGILPCRMCADKHSIDTAWYEKYKEISEIKKHYNIP